LRVRGMVSATDWFLRARSRKRGKGSIVNDYQDAIDKLTEEAELTGHGPAKIGLLEEAVRLADTHGDTEAGFNIRLTLMEASSFAGRPDLLLVAFSWCLAQHDRDPDLFGDEDLLWKYKWVVNHLPDFP